MIEHAREITSIEHLGYEVLYIGESRPKCTKCGRFALVRKKSDAYLCEKMRDGCGATLDFKDIGPRVKLWRVGKYINGLYTLVYIGEEVLERLPKLTKEQFHAWYMQWDDEAIIDTLAKADLPDELSKVEKSILMPPPEPKGKVERIGKIRI